MWDRLNFVTDAPPTGGEPKAAVLAPLFEDAQGRLRLLLTKRPMTMPTHAGHLAFPGGRPDPGDNGPVETALRETHEEVGIEPRHVTVIGFLRPMPTITGYAVTPVVGLVSAAAELAVDRTEVEHAFEVPLEFLLDERNDRRVEREIHGRSIPMVEFHFEGRRIWGATAQIILSLRKNIKK